ncbi:phage tail assembly chaperone [Klebsiella pneumoniae]
MEFEIKGVNYRTAKLDVFQQLKVSRKLLPVLAGLVSEYSTLKAQAAAGNSGAVLESVLPKIADTLSALPDEDVNAVIYPCLSVVNRQHQKGWVKVFDQGALMFDDIDLFTMLQLVARVVADSLGNFLKELPDNEKVAPSPQA